MNPMVSRRTFLKSIGLTAAAITASRFADSTPQTTRAKKTNILLILADDMGYECVGAYGGLSYKTPHLDRLAAEGVLFTHCYSLPLCTPSRVQIMTGQYNIRNYVRFGVLRPGEKTFAHLLKSRGYATACAGKWQLNANFQGQLPQQAGFDEHCLWQLNVVGSRYRDPTYTLNGKVVRDEQGKYGPDIFSDFCLDFIQRNADRPFFVYYPTCLPHAPFQPTPNSPEWKDQKDKTHKRFYKDMIEYLDTIVGKLVIGLEQNGLLDNTLILFTSDNGSPREIVSHTTRGDVAGMKGFPTDGGTRVPLIAYWKNHSARGEICDDLIDFSDFLPTLAEVTGDPLPDSWLTDGQSFLPQILGRVGNPKQAIFMYYNPKQKSAKWPICRFARDRRYKLYDSGQFYDVQYDPLEKNPLPDQRLTPTARAAKQALQKVLDQYKDLKSPDDIGDIE